MDYKVRAVQQGLQGGDVPALLGKEAVVTVSSDTLEVYIIFPLVYGSEGSVCCCQ